jgi:hypothetical protein
MTVSHPTTQNAIKLIKTLGRTLFGLIIWYSPLFYYPKNDQVFTNSTLLEVVNKFVEIA